MDLFHENNGVPCGPSERYWNALVRAYWAIDGSGLTGISCGDHKDLVLGLLIMKDHLFSFLGLLCKVDFLEVSDEAAEKAEMFREEVDKALYLVELSDEKPVFYPDFNFERGEESKERLNALFKSMFVY